jgi:flavin reductase (DIM6/NTAB) family NADH-FMN oxidoreductase RutF
MFYTIVNGHNLAHDPFKSLIVPRPIGWVSTISVKTGVNLAPFSFFNAVSSDPPMVLLGINGLHVEGGDKDTLLNIIETKDFVVNIATWELRHQMNKTSADFLRNVDEMETTKLISRESRLIKSPCLQNSPVNLECILHKIIYLPSSNKSSKNACVIGQVVGIHISDNILSEGIVDMDKFRPLARLGYMDYTVVDHKFTLKRPSVPGN